MERRQRKDVSVVDVGAKTQEICSRENPRNQVETENPIHSETPGVLETGVLEVGGVERYHYANLTVL